MRLLHALRYFAREAVVGLLRSWRVSVLSVFTIAVSLFLAGLFVLVGRNLSRTVAHWKQDSRFVVYLSAGATPEQRSAIEQRLRQAPWVASLEPVSSEQSAARFRAAFPSLAELVADSRYGSLPASIEARFRPADDALRPEIQRWQQEIGGLPGVEMVDDDRDWIGDVETLIRIVEAVGSLLGAILVGASVFTIAAVVRLTSYLYRDEIAVMRLVGATEFFIRGPFYVEGMLQGVLGALLALLTLQATHLTLAARFGDSLLLRLLAHDFLSGLEIGALLVFGAAAGLAGAVVSLGREVPTSEQA